MSKYSNISSINSVGKLKIPTGSGFLLVDIASDSFAFDVLGLDWLSLLVTFAFGFGTDRANFVLREPGATEWLDGIVLKN